MLRPLLIASCTLALALLMTSSAWAQFGRPQLSLPPSVQNLMLLRNEAVQKELALDADQQKTISDLATQMQSEAMEIFSGLQDLSPEERQKELPGLMKMMGEKGKELQGKVDKTLNAKQLTRLKELSIQRRNISALEDEEVRSVLKFSEEQQQKLVAIRDEAVTKSQEIMKAVSEGGDRAAIREKMQTLQKELGEKALAVLTPEQREAFEKMKGAKFEFPQGRGGPFGGF